MKIYCPNCSTGFSVPEVALGPRGRKLKCVRCGHLWHQEPAAGAATEVDATTASPRARPEPVRGPLSSLLEAEEPGPASVEPPPSLEVAPGPSPDTAPDLDLADPEPPRRDDAFSPVPDASVDDIPMHSEPDGARKGPPAEDEGPEPDLDDILERLAWQERDRSRRGDDMDPDALTDDFDLDEGDDREPLPGILRTQLKAQRRKIRPPSWASALVAVVVLLAGAMGGAYLGRDSVVGMWPAAEKWYAAVGIPLSRPGLGLTLEEVVPTHELVDGNKLLVVRGFVTNTSEIVRPVPALRLALKDDDGDLVQQMVASPSVETLDPGETTTFRMTVENLLPEAAIIDVGFTDRQPEPVMAPVAPTPVAPTTGMRGGGSEGQGSQTPPGVSHGDAPGAPMPATPAATGDQAAGGGHGEGHAGPSTPAH